MVQVDDGDDRVELRQSIVGWVEAKQVRTPELWCEITSAYVHTRVYLFDLSNNRYLNKTKTCDFFQGEMLSEVCSAAVKYCTHLH